MKIQLQSKAAQVAEALRQEITHRTWQNVLPGERQLADRFQVSRKTLRKALAELRAEGVVITQHSRASRLAPKARRRSAGAGLLTRVALLLPEPLEANRPFTVLWVNRLMALLQDGGLHLEVFDGVKYYGASAGRSLRRLVDTHPARCWIISRTNRPLQAWFANAGVACLVAGSAHVGMRLPSVDTDHRALGRHAGALFARHHHHVVALFLERLDHAGDVESEQGFREGMARGKGTTPQIYVSRIDRSAPAIIRELRLLLALPRPPTGLLLSNSYSYLTVLSYLASLGSRVPHDLSIVSRDEEPFLNFLYPKPAYYSTNPHRLAGALNQAIKRILSGDHRLFSIQIMPNFVKGDSIGDLQPGPDRRG